MIEGGTNKKKMKNKKYRNLKYFHLISYEYLKILYLNKINLICCFFSNVNCGFLSLELNTIQATKQTLFPH